MVPWPMRPRAGGVNDRCNAKVANKRRDIICHIIRQHEEKGPLS